MTPKNSQFKIFLIGLIIVLGAVGPLLSVNFATLPVSEPCNQTEDLEIAQTAMNLYQATTNPAFMTLVSVSIRGVSAAPFWGQCINITAVQLTVGNVYLTIRLGEKLVPADSGVQTMVIAEEYTMFLTFSGDSETYLFYAFCTESADSAPGISDTFIVESTPYNSSTCVGKILIYLDAVNSTFLGTQVGQYAIWACIDGTTTIAPLAQSFGLVDQVNYLLYHSGTGLSLEAGSNIPGFNLFIVLMTLIPIISLSILLPKRNKFQDPH